MKKLLLALFLAALALPISASADVILTFGQAINGDDIATRLARMGFSADAITQVLVVEPLAQRLDLVHCERRIDVVDAYVRG